MVVFVRTIVLYIVVVAVMRIMGKRQIGELQPFELVIAIMLSELAAVPMQDTGIPLIYGLIPIFTLMFLEIFISFITLKSRKLRKIVCGTASVVIEHGRLREEELRKQRFNLDDLMEELRISGYLNISDIEYAIMETSGKISVIPKSDNTPVTRQDLNIKKPDEELPISLILDGKVNSYNLKFINHDTNWLMNKLKENDIDKVENAFIALLDSNGKFFVQRRQGS
jgi:uncharacterized membrane protein YcaP (DUF421 family)